LDVKDIKDKIKDLSKKEEDSNFEIRNIYAELGAYKKQLENIESILIENKKIEEFIETNTNKKHKFQALLKVFGKNGIPKMLMKKVVPILEYEANKLLNIFDPNTEISIEFDLDPMTKEGTEKVEGGLDIIINNKGRRQKLELYSGGETTRITFAIVLALAELLSRRSGKQIKSLIIDERISGLDDYGIMQFAEILREVRRRYLKIIIITHIDKLKELIEKTILVTKDDEGSDIKVYA